MAQPPPPPRGWRAADPDRTERFEWIPTRAVPDEFAPTQSVYPDFVPTQAVPEDFVPTQAVPEDFVPTQAVPEDFVPTQAVPADRGPTRTGPPEWPPVLPGWQPAGGESPHTETTESGIWAGRSFTSTDPSGYNRSAAGSVTAAFDASATTAFGSPATTEAFGSPATAAGEPTVSAARSGAPTVAATGVERTTGRATGVERTFGPAAVPGGGRELRFGPGVPAAPPAPAAPAWPRLPTARARQRRSPVRVGASILSTVLTLALIAAVGLYLWQRIRPLEIVSVTAGVPRPPGETCDTTVDVVATVHTNGNAGTISYQWFRSGSEPGGVLTERVARGQKTVTLHLAWSFSGVGTTTRTATVNIISPSPAQATTSVTYTCRR